VLLRPFFMATDTGGRKTAIRTSGTLIGQHRTARNSALLHLAEYLPAGVLADLFGLHLTGAEKWSTAAGSRWLTYAGDR